MSRTKALLTLSCLLASTPALGQTQILVPVQGFLTDAAGSPIASTITMTFSIYANATATTPLWTETQMVQVGSVFPGVYTARLGSATTLSAELFRDNPNTHFGVRLPGDASDIGRWPLDTTPRSGWSALADRAMTGGVDTAMLDPRYVNISGDTMTGRLVLPQGGLLVGTRSLVVDSQGRVGIGTATPGHTLAVTGGSTRLDARRNAGFRLDLQGTGDFIIQETATNDIVHLGAMFHNISSGALGIGRQPSTWNANAIRLDVAGQIGIDGNAVVARAGNTVLLGDPNSGDGNTANLELRTNGARRMHIDGSGNAAIGGVAGSDARLKILGGNLKIEPGPERASNSLAFGQHANGDAIIWLPTFGAQGLQFKSGSTGPSGDRITFRSNGRIGVGTTNPASELDVRGQIRTTSLCLSGDCRNSFPSFVSQWSKTGAVVRLTTASDRVGIGTNTAMGRLHVIGDSRTDPLVVSSSSPGLFFWDTETASGVRRYDSFGIEVDGNRFYVGARSRTANPSVGGTNRRFQIDNRGHVSIVGANLGVRGVMTSGRHAAGDTTNYQIRVYRGGTPAAPGPHNRLPAFHAVDHAGNGPTVWEKRGLIAADYPRISENDSFAHHAALFTAINDSESGVRINGRGTMIVGYPDYRGNTLTRSTFIENALGVGTTDTINCGRHPAPSNGSMRCKMYVAGRSLMGEVYIGNSGREYGRFSWGGNRFILQAQRNTTLNLGSNGTNDDLHIAINGNVGIATQTPAHRLHVNGTAAASSLSAPEVCLGGVCRTTWPATNPTLTPWQRSGTTIRPVNAGDRINIGHRNTAWNRVTMVASNSNEAFELRPGGSHASRTNGSRFFTQSGYAGASGTPFVLEVQNGGTWRTSALFSHGDNASHPSLRTWRDTHLATQGGRVGVGTRTPHARLTVAGAVSVGIVRNVSRTGAGYGDRLHLSGGPDVSTSYNSDNSDPLWIARYNISSDVTEMRVNISDNAQNQDKLSVGYENAGRWFPVFNISAAGRLGLRTANPDREFDMVGNAIIRGNLHVTGTLRVDGTLDHRGHTVFHRYGLNGQMMAQATCVALNPSHWTLAVRRVCSNTAPSCATTCARLREGQSGWQRCVNALHIYGNQPFTPSQTHTLGLKTYRYNSCSGSYCGPNYCCCRGDGPP